MNNKILSLFLLSVILLTTSVLAASFTTSTPDVLTLAKQSINVTITNPVNSSLTLNVAVPAIQDTNNKSVAITAPLTLTVPALSTAILPLSFSSIPSEFLYSKFSTQVTLTNSANSTDTLSFPLYIRKTFCESGDRIDPVDSRTLRISSVKDTTSDTTWKWRPLETIDVDIDVKFDSNENDDTIDALIIPGIYDKTTGEIIDFDNQNEAELSISLDRGDTTTETLELKVPANLEKSSSRYQFFFKVYEDGNEDVVCRDYVGIDEEAFFKDLNINKDSYDVAITDIQFDSPLLCGETGRLSGRIVNVGSNSEKKAYVSLVNSELGINLESTPVSLGEGVDKDFSIEFNIPADAIQKTYTLKAYTHYRYSSDTKAYRSTSDSYDLKLELENCVAPVTDSVLITASLDSDAVAGSQFVVKATVKNTGSASTAFTILTSGTESFATLTSIDPQSFTLGAGQSKDVTITLKANSDASGDKSFTIKALYGSNVKDQTVSLNIQAKSSMFSGFSGSAIVNSIKNNWVVWVIVIVNIVLIALIVVVAIRILRK